MLFNNFRVIQNKMDKLSLFPVIFRIHFHLLPPFHLSCPIKICAPQALIGASWNFYGVKNFYGKWHKIGKSNSKSCCTHFCTTSHNLYWNCGELIACDWCEERKLGRNIALRYVSYVTSDKVAQSVAVGFKDFYASAMISQPSYLTIYCTILS